MVGEEYLKHAEFDDIIILINTVLPNMPLRVLPQCGEADVNYTTLRR